VILIFAWFRGLFIRRSDVVGRFVKRSARLASAS
jgi:hypothetical protein